MLETDDEIEYEIIGRRFESQFSGRCAVDWNHRVKRGDIVAKVQRADNPFLPVAGVACGACTKDLPRAR